MMAAMKPSGRRIAVAAVIAAVGLLAAGLLWFGLPLGSTLGERFTGGEPVTVELDDGPLWDSPDDAVDRDQLLTNVLYWLTGTAGSSARIYYERAHSAYWGAPPGVSSTPTALAVFPRENFLALRAT